MPILIGLGSFIGLFLAYVATRPSAFRIERSRTLDAPPAKLFALINDFHEWAKWSPWEKLDPDMKRVFEGPDAGLGATYRWIGTNNKAGEGVMKIATSQPDARVEIDLTFIKPIAAENKAIFTLEPDGNGTKVVWAMEGNRNFGHKAFGVFVDMDKLVGADFEKGLGAMGDAAKG